MNELMLVFESSERSDEVNEVRKILDKSKEFKFIDFEGYTVKNKKVSLLLDRAKFVSKEKTTKKDIYDYICGLFGEDIEIKTRLAKKLDVPWYFVVYGENETSIVLDMLDEGRRVYEFSNFKELAKWTVDYRGYVMKSDFEEDGLPTIDIKMRSIGIPWPGNLDKALSKDGDVVALIEYQKTNSEISTVRQHDNNRYFRNTYQANNRGEYKFARIGDENRWKVLHEFANQAGLPILVIVWSETEKEVGLKLIKDIVYTTWPSTNNSNPNNSSAGIEWNAINYVDISNVEINIKNMLNL